MQTFEQARDALAGQVMRGIWWVQSEWVEDVCELIERCGTWCELGQMREVMRECGW